MVNNKGTNNVNHGAKGMTNSYAHVVKGNQIQNVGMEECPNMVLDETCLNHEDFSLCLLENVMEFASLTNLKVTKGLYGWRLRGFHVSGGLEIHLAVSHLDGDPFGIYEVLNKRRDGKNIDDKHEDSLKYPPGFTPNEDGDVPVEKVDNWSDENRVNDGHVDGLCVVQHVHERVEVSNDTHESTGSGHFKKSEVPRKGRSILELIDDLVNVGQTMGYDMTRCIKNMEEIIESQGWDEITYYISMCSSRFKRKKVLWDYLSFVIGNWDGEVVIMGDFNEVRDISERFGSIFNKHGVEAFNSFIANAGLVEVPLEQTWLEANVNDQDSYSKFMNKLKYLKENIRIWARLHKESLNSRKSILKNDDLEREVSNEDIKRAVWDCGTDKAPGPDGFTFGFYRRYWHIIGNDVVDVVK
nr:RNA-directed DNA polymerase, eukaryota [Tanacetum cinerariifolium]